MSSYNDSNYRMLSTFLRVPVTSYAAWCR